MPRRVFLDDPLLRDQVRDLSRDQVLQLANIYARWSVALVTYLGETDQALSDPQVRACLRCLSRLRRK